MKSNHFSAVCACGPALVLRLKVSVARERSCFTPAHRPGRGGSFFHQPLAVVLLHAGTQMEYVGVLLVDSPLISVQRTESAQFSFSVIMF